MKVLNLLTSGETGGIESLCRDIGQYSNFENGFCFVTHGGGVYERMRGEGMVTYCLERPGNKLSVKKLFEIAKIARQYDVITVHHGDPILKMYFILLKILARKKMVTMIHSCYDEKHFAGYGKLKRYICNAIFALGMKVSNAVIFVSEAGEKSYLKKYGKIKNTYVVYNGISPQKIELGKQNVRKKEKPYNVTYIGRLNKIKGVNVLIEAVVRLHRQYDVRLNIIGDGLEREKLDKMTQNLGISGITTFYGQKMDVAPYLQEATVFVYPSVCQEVFGISIVEALAFGVPCVATSVGGIPEIIVDGENGFLCQPFDADELAAKIQKTFQEDMDEIVVQGRKTAEKFNVLKTVSKLERIYRTL